MLERKLRFVAILGTLVLLKTVCTVHEHLQANARPPSSYTWEWQMSAVKWTLLSRCSSSDATTPASITIAVTDCGGSLRRGSSAEVLSDLHHNHNPVALVLTSTSICACNHISPRPPEPRRLHYSAAHQLEKPLSLSAKLLMVPTSTPRPADWLAL